MTEPLERVTFTFVMKASDLAAIEWRYIDVQQYLTVNGKTYPMWLGKG